ncbi:MAG: NAD-binding protein, partial [Candidatus Aminicenantes bacterium]|nr:NAD-binding protein [Candidatus Aminicenantes bacterium]
FSILIIKASVVVLTARILGHSPRIALITGLSLAQIGEFSFVLAGVGRANGLLPDDAFQLFLASSILTMLATPFIIQLSPALAERTERVLRWKPPVPKAGRESGKRRKDHVIVAGFGLNGRNLAHVLKEAGLPYVILELNPETVCRAAKEGEPIIFGDASSRTILKEAGINRAKGMVIAISDPAMTRRAVRAARDMNKNAFLIVRTRYASEIDGLFRLGATDVIPEEFETSIEIFTRVLEKLFIPKNIIDAQVKILRGECYGILRGSCSAVRPSLEKIADFMAAGTAETFYVAGGTWPAGKKLKTVNLRKKTGATIIAVVRGDRSFTSPGANFMIEEGDTLVLVANHRDMNRAFGFLTTGETE